MTALRDMTAEQLDRIDSILAEYKQTEDDARLSYQRKRRRKTTAVILSFDVLGKVIKGTFTHSFTIFDDGRFTKKTTYKGVGNGHTAH